MKKKLKIVFKKDVENLGLFGEVKEVAAGFARNYLIPKGLALYLKDPRSKQILTRKEEVAKKQEKEIENLRKIAETLQGKIFIFKSKIGDKGKLFGSIGVDDIVAKIKEDCKIKLEKKQIVATQIKEVGDREVVAKLGYDIEAKFVVKVEPEAKTKPKTKKANK